MKKYLIIFAGGLITVILLYTAYYQWGFYRISDSHKPVTTFTKTTGKEIWVDQGNGFAPFEIKGVNMGVGIPGYFATEYAIKKSDYLRWFQMIQDMGANTIRVYTILAPDFYQAVYEYNRDNPQPLYILHGVWVDDYVQNSSLDAFDDAYLKTLIQDCKTLVDVLHGRKQWNLLHQTTSASGFYHRDISPWVLGYILGVEWEDRTVAYTDHTCTDQSSYQGEFLYTSENASPFEAMLAQVGDEMIRYETRKYHTQRLMAFSNWPTTDPIPYPESINQLFFKCAQVDVEHIKQTEQFFSGQFASYHTYPYYPDYLNFYDSWKTTLKGADNYRLEDGTYNTYGAYLEMINQHHAMPVVISEFGVPTSRGRAQNDANTGRAQGYLSETQQGQALVQCYWDIRQAGCAGSVIFSWQDEWFKRTWNTMANTDLNQTAYWSDVQTNEQFFGLMAFDPGREPVCLTDGEVEEWTDQDVVSTGPDYTLSCRYDEKFLYFRVHKTSGLMGEEPLYIPLDITPNSGTYYDENLGLRFVRPTDFLIQLDGPDNSRLYVQARYDSFHVVFSEQQGLENPFFHPPDKDSPEFHKVWMPLQLKRIASAGIGLYQGEQMETGTLTYGNGNPDAPDFLSISDFIIQGNELELRIPWLLLNFSNPSDVIIHDDYYEHYGIQNFKIDTIYVGLGSGSSSLRIPMDPVPLKGWKNTPTYRERLKKSYDMIQQLWTQPGS